MSFSFQCHFKEVLKPMWKAPDFSYSVISHPTTPPPPVKSLTTKWQFWSYTYKNTPSLVSYLFEKSFSHRKLISFGNDFLNLIYAKQIPVPRRTCICGRYTTARSEITHQWAVSEWRRELQPGLRNLMKHNLPWKK